MNASKIFSDTKVLKLVTLEVDNHCRKGAAPAKFATDKNGEPCIKLFADTGKKPTLMGVVKLNIRGEIIIDNSGWAYNQTQSIIDSLKKIFEANA
jgi:hypothetical protein